MVNIEDFAEEKVGCSHCSKGCFLGEGLGMPGKFLSNKNSRNLEDLLATDELGWRFFFEGFFFGFFDLIGLAFYLLKPDPKNFR